MRIARAIELSHEQRKTLLRLSRGQKVSVRLARRARIVLLASAGAQNRSIAAQLGISRYNVARWRDRFVRLGLSGIEKDAPRPGRKPMLSAALRKEIVQMTLEQKPANATHWSRARMAAKVGVSASSVGRVWREHGLQHEKVKAWQATTEARFVRLNVHFTVSHELSKLLTDADGLH